MSSRLSPVAAFRRVTMRQAIEQRCFDFEPKTVEAGADRDITVTAELENTTNDESFDHVWRIEIDGSGIGFNTTTVPPGETVRPQQTQTIPEALLPVDGGFVDVVIQQIGGFQQTTRCGNLEVLPTEEEPVPEGDIVLTDLRVPSTVTEGELVTIEIETECVDGFCEQETLVLTVDGSPVFTGGSTGAGPFEQGRTRTFTANVTFDRAGSADVVAELNGERLSTTVDVQSAAPTFDPALVDLEGCEITPRKVDPGDQFVYSVFLANGNPEPVDIDLTWSISGGVLDRDLSRTVPAGVTRHELTTETTTEIAGLLPGQTVDVTVEVTNSDVGIALSGRCGQVSVSGGFDEAAVFVPENECTVSPLEVTPPQNVDLRAGVINDNLFSAIAEVEWVWEGLRIASTEVSVDAESQATARATATIEREGRGQVTAEVIRASGGVASSPRSPAVGPARAGASNEVSPD